MEYKESIKQIKTHITQYSFIDAAKSVYTINAWLPNISSQVKMFLFNQLLKNISPKDFTKIKKVETYSDFTDFAVVLLKLAPDFPMLEDYIPVNDFGEIKYYYNRRFYKVFYGGGYTSMYEYYQIFESTYLPLNDLFVKHLKLNSKNDFSNLLMFLDNTINNLRTKSIENKIEQGHIEIPSIDFWMKCSKFIKLLNTKQLVESDFVEKFSSTPKTKRENTSLETETNFVEKLYNGEDKLFIKFEDEIIPLFTRDCIVVLVNYYANKLETLCKKVDFIEIKKRIDIGIIKFIKDRFNEKNYEILMSSVNEKTKQNGDIIYTFTFQTEEKQYLFYFYDELKQDLNIINQKFINDKVVIEENNNTFYNYYKQQALKLINPKPIFQYLILPNYSTKPQSYKLPKNQKFSYLLLRDFYYIFDEIKIFEEFSKYEEFKDKNNKVFATDEIDRFAAFKDSNSILIEGAIEPTLINVSPHWGDSYRFESLKKFWNLYPEKSNYRHPRGWDVKLKYDHIVEMFNKQDKDLINYIKINNSHIFCSCSFKVLTLEQFKITSFLSECLTYNLQKFYYQIKKINSLSNDIEILIKVFPNTIIDNSNYDHLNYLYPIDEIWKMNMIKTKYGFYLVHFVYNEKLVNENFTNTSNREYENKMIIDFLNSINQISKINKFSDIKKSINKTLNNKPGYVLHKIRQDYSHIEQISLILPEIKDFKMARNKIANIAKNNSIKEGKYSKKEGLDVINKIKEVITLEIENEVKKLDITSLYFFIEQVDELSHRNIVKNRLIQKSKNQEIIYNNEEQLSKEKKEFYRNRKNIHYLIEMFVSSNKNGTKILTEDIYKYLFALTNWLFVILESTDALYYDLNDNCEIEISSDFLVNIIYDETTMLNKNNFVDYRSKQSINDNLFFSPYSNQSEIDILLNKFDEVFLEEYNFKYRDIFTFLDLLANWDLSKSSNLCIDISKEKIIEYLSPDIKSDEANRIIDFLTLDSSLIKSIISPENIIKVDYIPVLEHNKRHHRYTIRPIIKNTKSNTYTWGTVSAYKSRSAWNWHLSMGQLPYITQKIKINNLIKSEEKNIQDKIVEISFDKIKKYFSGKYVFKEKELYKLDKKGNHPRNLGDFDLLVFSEKYNLILNIECKYIKPSYSMKDSKNDMEKIFYKKGKKKSYISKLIKRQQYLTQNISKIYKNLNLNFNDFTKIKIIPIFLTMTHLYWTKFPPLKSDIVFLCINELDEYLDNIIRSS